MYRGMWLSNRVMTGFSVQHESLWIHRLWLGACLFLPFCSIQGGGLLHAHLQRGLTTVLAQCAAWKAGSSVSSVINVCAAWWPNFTRCVSVWVVQRQVRYWGAWYRRTASSWSAERDKATAWGSIGRLWQTNIHSMSISSTKPPACTPEQFVSCAFLKANVP